MHLTASEMQALGIEHGDNVRIHRSCVLIGAENLKIGNNVRIDCFALISAGEEGITIGNHVHIAAGTYLFGGGGPIVMEDFSGLSSRVSLYTSTDDYVDGFMTNPTVPLALRHVRSAGITIRKHAIVGASSVILPGVELGEGSAIGALTCVQRNVGDFEICISEGHRQRVVGRRGKLMLDLEKRLEPAQSPVPPPVIDPSLGNLTNVPASQASP